MSGGSGTGWKRAHVGSGCGNELFNLSGANRAGHARAISSNQGGRAGDLVFATQLQIRCRAAVSHWVADTGCSRSM